MYLLLLPLLLVFHCVLAAGKQTPFQAPQLDNVTLVPVTLGVMSKCPDAALCESVFDDVVDRAGSKMDLSLSFIATLNDSDSTFGVTCLHGPVECAGNIHELCVAHHNPDLKVWWPFIHCLNYQGRSRIGREAVARSCAKVVGIDWEESGVGPCVDGLQGAELLRESVKKSQDMGLEHSCTIMINGVKRCMVNGGRWTQCDDGHTVGDFVQRINSEYSKLNS